MKEYDPSLGPPRAPGILIDEADKFDPVEAKRRAEMFAKLGEALASFIGPHVKARLDTDSEFSDVDVMVAGARETLQMLDQIGETAQDEVPQEMIFELGENLDAAEERINTNPEGFFEDAKQDTLERETSDIVTCFLSQFTSEVHHNQDDDELELSPDTFLPYGSKYHEVNISRSGWDEETYRHTITTCMQKLLEENNGELELPSGQSVLKQGDKYVVVSSN